MNDNSRVLIARTAVENVPYENERLFEYTVPDLLKDSVCAGMRVAVPFGNGKKSRTAFIVELYDADASPDGYKQINSLIDKYPVVSEELIGCARFISERCFCTLYESIKAMLPAGINYKISVRYSLVDCCPEGDISQTERDILTMLKNNEQPLAKESICEAFDKNIDSEISHLESIKAIARIDDVSRKIKDASIKSIRLKDREISDIRLTPKQSEVYDLLCMQESASVKEICYFLGITPSVTDSLVKKGIAEYFEEEMFRIPQVDCLSDEPAEEIKLNPEQTKAYDNLEKLLCDGKPHASLLYGVTGSGKTSVFTCLIDKALSENKGTIVMVPEISLTPQMISKFKKRYGNEIAVFHSGLSMGERLDEWKRVKFKKAHIVIGTRSAVFAPLENLGLIIIDEEQEHTYKSERSPRYHARDVAKFRCVQNNGLLVLSSATPSVETMYYAKKGIYSLNELPKRYGKAVLPDVITADMNEEAANGNRTPFSSVLLQTIEDNLNAGRQSIILLNRRGYNTYVSCKKCGKIVDCPNCSVSMTYHHANNRMMCHYCGYSMSFTGVCPNCSAENSLRLSGTGTQKAEIDLSDIFPSARILRLDADSTLKKGSHAKLLAAFARGEYDILLGTQMVAKGLDFPNVTLVGVLSADNVMYGNDFRSYERAFSLITQVVGRSGRGDAPGVAVIQTRTPENPIIELASRQDYDSFYESDIKIRKAMLYPPFSELCFIVFSGAERASVQMAANEFSRELCDLAKTEYSHLPLRVLGPSPAMVIRVNGKYRYKLILKFKNSADFRNMVSSLLKSAEKKLKSKHISVYADINPENII